MDINLARFDLVTIRLAVLCAESGSLSAAAKLAHCSISAGSQRLAALEAALGKPLFVRDHRGLHPTQAGDLFVHHARIILGDLEVLEWQMARLGSGDLPRRQPQGKPQGERYALMATAG